jgi:hypothetical protein
MSQVLKMGECFIDFGGDLDIDKLLEQDDAFNEPSLEDHLEECFAPLGYDINLNMLFEQADALLDSNKY